MPAWQIVLIALAAAILLPWIVEYIRIMVLVDQEKKSETFLMRNVRYILYIIGQIRAGKTTLLSALANIRTKFLMKKARMKVEFCCRAFPRVPFDAAEMVLKDDLKAGAIDAYGEARKLCGSGMVMNSFTNLSYDNHIAPNPTPFVNILASYIEAEWALLRNNYVYYYGKAFRSRITNNDAMDYTPEMLGIKNCMENELNANGKKDKGAKSDYHLLAYSVIAEDEKQVSGKDALRFFDYAKEDSGAADCLRLMGQLGEETIFYMTTNQCWGTDINRERNLATEEILVNDSMAINPYFMEMLVLRILEIPAKIYLHFLKSKSDRAGLRSPLLFPSWARSWLSVTNDLKKRLAAKGFVIYHGIIYHNPNDFGKKAKTATFKTDQMRVVLPLLYCYGSIDTFQFHSVQQKLIENSRYRLTDEEKAARPEELADAVLRKSTRERKEAQKAAS